MQNKIGGVIPAVPTFFQKNEELDTDALKNHLDYLVASGVHEVCVLGSTGEGLYLNREEQKRVMVVTVDQVNGRVPVIAGTGCIATKATVELTRIANDVGIDAAMVVLPTYFSFERQEVYNHYANVVNSVELPVLLYNFPENTNFNMSPELVAGLSKVNGIVGIKDTIVDLGHMLKILELTGKDFVVLSGIELLLAALVEKGGKGSIGPIANFAPKVVLEFYDAVKSGEATRIADYIQRISVLSGVLTTGPIVSAIKEAIKATGLDAPTTVRSPLARLTPEQIARIRGILAKFKDE